MQRVLIVLALAATVSANIAIAGFFYFNDEFIVYNVKSLVKKP
jgi:hypothetical protein